MATAAIATAQDALPPHEVPVHELLPEDDFLAADDFENTDSAYAGTYGSDTTSVDSASYRGYVENGRRYVIVNKPYFTPVNQEKWASQEARHLVFMILDCQQENPLFRAKLNENAQYVLDIGCGRAEWAIEVADQFPNLSVYGDDAFPPPQTWIPPNCVLEVNDITKEWSLQHQWVLIHIRYGLGVFSNEDWVRLNAQAYKNTAPGGWIEQCENDIGWWNDDKYVPAASSSILRGSGVDMNKALPEELIDYGDIFFYEVADDEMLVPADNYILPSRRERVLPLH